MRVLHVYSGNLFGGIEAILLTIARSQAAGQGASHEFALAFHGRLERELLDAGARVHHLAPVRVSRPTSVRAGRSALARLLAFSSFDRVICHAPWSQAIFGSVVRKSATPLVFWAHDVMTGRHWTERLARRVVPDLAICNSRFTAGSLGTLYPAAPHAVVYAPVDTSQAAIDADGRRLARACLNTPEGAIAVVQASRLERWKGHGVLVEALSQLRDLPNWVWWQVGGAQRPAEAALLADLKRAVERAGLGDRVRWTGERDDVPTLLAAADIYCQPNTEPEPFGVVFIEALAAALPVVTSRIGGACEVIDDSCGALVEPRNATALAGELRTLIVNGEDRARLSRAAPGRARALCDASTQLKRLAVTLQSLVAAEVGA